MWPCNDPLGHLSQRHENSCLHRNMYTNLHSRFVYHSPKLETIQISLMGGMVKRNLKHPCNGMFLRNKKEQATDTCSNLDGSCRCYALWEKLILEANILYDSIYITSQNEKATGIENRLALAKAQGRARKWVNCTGVAQGVCSDRSGSGSWLWWLHKSTQTLHSTVHTHTHACKNWWTLNKVCSLVNSIVPMSTSWFWYHTTMSYMII